jgi:hypothetical protein
MNDHGCFIAGTAIETDQGSKSIESIRSGDMVLTRVGYRRVTASDLTDKNASIWEVQLSNGRCLLGTQNHPIWAEKQGFIALHALRYGDKVKVAPFSVESSSRATDTRSESIVPVHVISVRDLGRKAAVYNLTVSGVPEYFANGILVHNCDALRYMVAEIDGLGTYSAA